MVYLRFLLRPGSLTGSCSGWFSAGAEGFVQRDKRLHHRQLAVSFIVWATPQGVKNNIININGRKERTYIASKHS
jgi:hypothetical protein